MFGAVCPKHPKTQLDNNYRSGEDKYWLCDDKLFLPLYISVIFSNTGYVFVETCQSPLWLFTWSFVCCWETDSVILVMSLLTETCQSPLWLFTWTFVCCWETEAALLPYKSKIPGYSYWLVKSLSVVNFTKASLQVWFQEGLVNALQLPFELRLRCGYECTVHKSALWRITLWSHIDLLH